MVNKNRRNRGKGRGGGAPTPQTAAAGDTQEGVPQFPHPVTERPSTAESGLSYGGGRPPPLMQQPQSPARPSAAELGLGRGATKSPSVVQPQSPARPTVAELGLGRGATKSPSVVQPQSPARPSSAEMGLGRGAARSATTTTPGLEPTLQQRGVPPGRQAPSTGAQKSVAKLHTDISDTVVPKMAEMSLSFATTSGNNGRRALKKAMIRPDKGGTRGRKIQLIANHFNMTINSNVVVFMYDIDAQRESGGHGFDQKREKGVTHELRGAECTEVVAAFMKKNFPNIPVHNYLHDGKRIIYSIKQLPFQGEHLEGKVDIASADGSREMKYKFRLQATRNFGGKRHISELNDYVNESKHTVDFPMEVVRIIDVLFRCAYANAMISVGRGLFFRDPNMQQQLGNIWAYNPGLFVSVRPQWSVRLNVDKTQIAFFKQGKLVDLMYQFGQGKRWSDADWNKEFDSRKLGMLTKEFNRVRVHANHYKKPDGSSYQRKFTVFGFTQSPRIKKFKLEDNSWTTVEDYFKKTYKIQLEYPFAPCVKTSQQKNTYMPSELLFMEPYQKPAGKNKEIVAEIIKKAAVPAFQRREEINKLMASLDLKSNVYMKAFGIDIDTNMLKLLGRVLNPPKISYGPRRSVMPQPGKWQADRNDPRYHTPGETKYCNKWAFVNLDARCNDGKFYGMLTQQASQKGLVLAEPKYISASELGRIDNDKIKMIFDRLSNDNFEFILFVLSEFQELYQCIKVMGDIHYGIVTQCVLSKNVFKPPKAPSPMTVDNILLKINGKLGGVNWTLDMPQTELASSKVICVKDPCMIIGADVTHPSPTGGKSIKKSIAAVVASMDPTFTRYSVETREQTSKKGKDSNEIKEVIDDMKDIVVSLLNKFLNYNKGVKPVSLVFYRDGVSEGQFAEVLEKELLAIQEACRSLEQGYEPRITFVVVQKRHHTRLFPANTKDPKDAVGRSGNCPAGTVVDTDIVHRREFNFYLLSHEGIQGTSKPTLYHVLYDDNNWGSDDLQLFTFYLCHLYMRCTRAVSIPAPVYYAHLVAFRGRTWRGEDSSTVDSDSQASSGAASQSAQSDFELKVHENLARMFYL